MTSTALIAHWASKVREAVSEAQAKQAALDTIREAARITKLAYESDTADHFVLDRDERLLTEPGYALATLILKLTQE